MTREELRDYVDEQRSLNNIPYHVYSELIDGIDELEQEPCEDAISRQAAIDAFEKFIHELGIEDEPYNYGEMALSVKNVPPVNPQPKVGHWIDVFGGCECSECGCLEAGYSDYCPNCGAKMVDPQESEEAI